MQLKTSLPLALLLMLAAFSACKKDKDHSEPPLTKMELLTAGQWRMTVYTLSPPIDIDLDGQVDADGLATFQPCEKDDYLFFHTDGTAEINEGPTKCDASDPQTDTIKWAFVNDEKEIVIDGDRATIVELTKSRFRVSNPIGSSTGDNTVTNIK